MGEISQTERVSDEELDQMILKLERDGMTPKQLSLMIELREVRRAKGKPVAQVLSSRVGNDTSTIDKALPDGMALYAAPPAPTAPLELGDLLSMAASAIEDLLEHTDPNTSYYSGVWADVPGKLRAAMLSSRNSEQLEPVSNRDELPATQFKPVADLYGITSPTGSETSFTFDAIEAANFINGGWSVQEYVELERYQEAMIGNSPVTPDGCIPVSDHSMLPPLEYLDTVKFNADCAIHDPESIYTNEFFLSLDEVFGEMGNYSEPVQAKAVSMLIAEIFMLRGYSRAAPHQEAKSALEHGMQRYAGAMQKLSEGDD